MQLRLLDSRAAGAAVVCGEGTVTEARFYLPTSPFAVTGGGGRMTVVYPGFVHLTNPVGTRTMHSLAGAPFATRILFIAPTVLARLQTRPAGRRPHPSQPPGWQLPGWQVPTVDGAVRFPEFLMGDPGLSAELTAVFDALHRPLIAAPRRHAWSSEMRGDYMTGEQILAWSPRRVAVPCRWGSTR